MRKWVSANMGHVCVLIVGIGSTHPVAVEKTGMESPRRQHHDPNDVLGLDWSCMRTAPGVGPKLESRNSE